MKARAFKSGMTDSATASATYTISISPSKVATPTFSPLVGTYSNGQIVTISCGTSGAVIRFTSDGSEPTSSSDIYTDITLVIGTVTFRAKAFKSGMTDSDTASATYTVQSSVDTVATPTLSPTGGTYSSSQSVSITCGTSGVTIRYTVDGSEPTSTSAVYSSPIPVASTTLVKARAFKAGMTDSPTASALYTIQPASGVVATPILSPGAGSYTSTLSVTISCDTSGATIRYTLDGSEPTSSSAAYSGPIAVNTGTITIKAKAQKSGMTDSNTASATYIIGQQSQDLVPWSMLMPIGIMGIAVVALAFILLWYRKK